MVPAILLAMQAAMPASRCAPPAELHLDQPATIIAHVSYGCAGKAGVIEVRGPCGRIARLHGDWRRGSVLTDRNGAITVRLIDGRERGSSLTYRESVVEIRRAGQVIARAGGKMCSK